MAQWTIAERKFDNLVDQVLYNRGVIKDKDDKTKLDFLEPNFEKLHDPFLMRNLKKAVERIAEAKENGESVGIFADYDADGIPGAALLYKALKKIGIDTHVYIPNREAGYGLCEEGINFLAEKKCSLIVTVDLGIRNFKEALYCKKIGVELIITDHHTPDETIPQADLVINPKIKGDKYPFKELSGGGVAYKLIQGLSTKCHELDESFLKWNLDLVAISTITDVVPLLGENRILASFGLFVLRKTKNIGLNALYSVAKLSKENITAYNVGFQIGPRINAPGRMDHATKSFELLATDDPKEANELALWLEEKNQSRQLAMEKVEKEAIKKIEKNNLLQNKILVVAGNWIKGVIGPTASRLVEKFSRPVIMFSSEGNSFCGSARSIEGVNILALVTMSEQYLAKFGGHKGACGVTVLKSKFDGFLSSLLLNAEREIATEDLVKKIKIDGEAEASELNLRLYNSLKKIEPFGMGNPRPIFCLFGAEIQYLRKIGSNGRHLSFNLKTKKDSIKAVYFNGADSQLENHKKYDIAFSVDLDTWQGNKQIKLNILDTKIHD